MMQFRSVLIYMAAGITVLSIPLTAAAYQHPGLSNTRTELEFIREMVRQKKEPWYAAFQKVKKDANLNFTPRPAGHMNTPTGGAKHASTLNLIDNSNVAYYCSLVWWCTGDEKYGKKAVEVLNAWSYGNKSWSGSSTIWTALAPFFGHIAAEIMRHCSDLWSEKDIKQYEHWITKVIYPNIKNRLSDGRNSSKANWQAWMNAANLAIAIFTDNEAAFKGAVEDYKHFLPRNIFADGKNHETCRDMVHTQMGVGGNIYFCEMAYKHGLNMWDHLDNRLLKGTEYNIPFLIPNAGPAPNPGCGVKKSGPHPICSYEAAWNYYHLRKGLSCPKLEKIVMAARPVHNTLTHGEIFKAEQWRTGTIRRGAWEISGPSMSGRFSAKSRNDVRAISCNGSARSVLENDMIPPGVFLLAGSERMLLGF